MSNTSNSQMLLQHQSWQRERRIIELLSSLNYRTGELSSYLHNIACGVSELIAVDWTVVTFCQEGFETILASSLEIPEDAPRVYALHGRLIGTVMEVKRTLAVEDAIANPKYGKPAPGYRAYLGIPLQTSEGQVFGTICSFHQQAREFTSDEIQIVELFAERAATAIDHYHLYQKQCEFNQKLEAEVENRTAELRAVQAKLVEQERLAAIGEFSSIIVHEIRNPLTTMVMGLKYFKKTILTEASQERLSLALSEAGRLERLLSEILLYAKPQVLQLCELDVNDFIQELLLTIQEMPEALNRKIEFIPASSVVKISGDRDKLKQVFINIVRNACEAVADGDVIKWEVNTVLPDAVYINVHNDGNPIPPEILCKLSQPFFSTKAEGTGLGLAITKRIVNAHGGKLCIQSQPLTGTDVTVQLPVLN
ncbi:MULTISPECIES: ATP-binding protein [unclassified Tolypothrix]|uniref:ATP-binding protein n=1 Tax=unclassified Tolypothrix TaxID=2649714 RepID=UPI0009DB4F12|nr:MULTISPECIES: ATP-binding protein [unclassified Tolypothrix]MBE9087632.1 GAF domain-containing protein [Tolypothrix sp. LEGE 11397]UYD23834.1 GAF domain-containing protein [Tolypothrix sp. PCC 7712]UYD33941.1 GAF domain-containing protein [Tolypothrix sp. PCC 7601]BAY89554.1 GAF sensor signal transduction histidine kinase [Microchaete diplosiphon NIES-3275]